MSYLSNELNDFKNLIDDIGKPEESKVFTIIEYPIDNYVIKVKIDLEGKFMGIEEIKVKKNFISLNNLNLSQYFDFEKYYEDTDDSEED